MKNTAQSSSTSLLSKLKAGINPFTPPSPPKPLAEDFVLSGVIAINPGGNYLRDYSLEITVGKIQWISNNASFINKQKTLKEFSGAYVLPGLIDMHTHLPANNILKLPGFAALLYLRNGITSIRDAGDADGTALPAAINGMERGEFYGPRIFACGFISGEPKLMPNSITVTKEGDAAKAVKQLKASGYFGIKSYEGLTLQQVKEILRTAEELNMPVMGHIPHGIGYEDALIPDVQHFHGVPESSSLTGKSILQRVKDWQDVDKPRMNKILEVTLKHVIINTPTLGSFEALVKYYQHYDSAINHSNFEYMPRLYREVIWHPNKGLPFYRGAENFKYQMMESYDKKKELLNLLYKNGATIQIGTDTVQPFTIWGKAVHEEMRIFNECGIPEEEIWTIATSKAGKALKVPMLGTIQEMAPADLLLFEKNPIEDLENLNSLMAVVSKGKIFRVKDMDKALMEWKKHFNGMIFDHMSVSAGKKAMIQFNNNHESIMQQLQL